MVTKKPKGLGRGLEALLGPTAHESGEGEHGATPGAPSSLPLGEMVPGMYQPRTRMDEGALYELAAAMSLIENIQREDLNPLEEAHGLQRLVKEFGLTHEQAAQAVGRSRSAATNLLRLLNL